MADLTADLAQWLRDLHAFYESHPIGWTLLGCDCYDHAGFFGALMERKRELLARCDEASERPASPAIKEGSEWSR